MVASAHAQDNIVRQLLKKGDMPLDYKQMKVGSPSASIYCILAHAYGRDVCTVLVARACGEYCIHYASSTCLWD